MPLTQPPISVTQNGNTALLSIFAAEATSKMRATTPTTTLADQLAATPLVGCAFFKLRSAYAGSCVKIRRSSDSTTKDIGFDLSGRVDMAAVRAFVGTSTPYIDTLYDQIGANNLTQATTGSQPELGFQYTRNGLPYAIFTGGAHLVMPAGVAVTARNNCSVWTAQRNHSLRVGYRYFTLDTTSKLAIQAPTSTTSVQMVIDGANGAGFGTMKSQSSCLGTVTGLNMSGSASTYYVAGRSYAAAAQSAAAMTGGYWPSNDSAGTAQDGYALLIFNAALSAADVAVLQYGLTNILNLQTAETAKMILQGDSNVTGGGPAGVNHHAEMQRYLPPEFGVYAFGLGGQTAASELGEAATYVDSLYDATMRNVAVFLGGSNEIRTGVSAATLAGTFTSWAQGRRTAGFQTLGHMTIPKSIVGTGSYTQAMENVRAAFASWQRANTGPGQLFDFLVDLEIEPRFNPWTIIESTDNLHFSFAGYRLASYLLAEKAARYLMQ